MQASLSSATDAQECRTGGSVRAIFRFHEIQWLSSHPNVGQGCFFANSRYRQAHRWRIGQINLVGRHDLDVYAFCPVGRFAGRRFVRLKAWFGLPYSFTAQVDAHRAVGEFRDSIQSLGVRVAANTMKRKAAGAISRSPLISKPYSFLDASRLSPDMERPVDNRRYSLLPSGPTA